MVCHRVFGSVDSLVDHQICNCLESDRPYTTRDQFHSGPKIFLNLVDIGTIHGGRYGIIAFGFDCASVASTSKVYNKLCNEMSQYQ